MKFCIKTLGTETRSIGMNIKMLCSLFGFFCYMIPVSAIGPSTAYFVTGTVLGGVGLYCGSEAHREYNYHQKKLPDALQEVMQLTITSGDPECIHHAWKDFGKVYGKTILLALGAGVFLGSAIRCFLIGVVI